jgi:hypothetical protein
MEQRPDLTASDLASGLLLGEGVRIGPGVEIGGHVVIHAGPDRQRSRASGWRRRSCSPEHSSGTARSQVVRSRSANALPWDRPSQRGGQRRNRLTRQHPEQLLHHGGHGHPGRGVRRAGSDHDQHPHRGSHPFGVGEAGLVLRCECRVGAAPCCVRVSRWARRRSSPPEPWSCGTRPLVPWSRASQRAWSAKSRGKDLHEQWRRS